MKPHMIITPQMVLDAKIRAGMRPTLYLQHKPGSALHTDEQDKCKDFYKCPCWNVIPARPEDREALDILTPFDAMASEDAADDFRGGMGDAYLSWYDARYIKDRPELTCDGMVAFMTQPLIEGESERWRLGWIAGTLIALGESNPDFMHRYESAQEGEVAPPVDSKRLV